MIRLFKSLAAKLWVSLLLIVILVGLLTSAGRLFTPLLSEFKTELASVASEALGQPVELRELRARWGAWGPEIVMRDVYLKHPVTGRKTLQIAEIDVAVNLLESLAARTIVPRHVSLVGVKLAVRLEKEGRLTVRGLDQLDDSDGDSSAIFLLPGRISVTKSEVSWENRAMEGPPIVFSDVSLHLLNDGDRHQLKGVLQPADYEKGRVSLALEILGDTSDPADWSGEAYLKGDSFPLARLLSNRLPPEYALLNGLGDFEVWGTLHSASLVDLTGTVDGRDIIVERRAESDSVSDSLLQIDRAGGAFQLHLTEEGWDFRGRDIRFEREGHDSSLGRFEVVTRRDESGSLNLQAGSDYLPLAQVDALARFLIPPNHELQQRLYAIAPDGELYDLRVRVREEGDGWSWSLDGDVSGLTTSPWQGIPGVDRLSFRFSADQGRGRIDFDTLGGALRFETLFREPLLLDELRGRVDWVLDADGGWSASSSKITAANRDIRTESRFSLTVPAPAGESPFLDLQTDFSEGDGSTTSRYLPVGIMGDKLVDWLDRGIVEGRVVSGSCLIRGRLSDFPFARTQSGRFEVLFDVEDVQLDYLPGWPAARKVDAEVRFLNDRFDAWVSDASIYASRVGRVHARIAELGGSALELDGRVRGALSDGLKFLRESPLRDNFGPLVSDISGKGEISIDLDMVVPLGGGSRPSTSGAISFLDADLLIPNKKLSIDDIAGVIRFDDNHLWGEGIGAKLFGREIVLEAGTGDIPDNTRLRAQGVFAPGELLELLQNIRIEQLDGEAQWDFVLDIPHRVNGGQRALDARLYSDLKGVSIDLPEPFGKPADEPRRIQLSTDFAAEEQLHLTLRYGTLVSAYLLLAEDELRRLSLRGGNVALGGRTARRPDTADLNIRGDLALLDLSRLPPPSDVRIESVPLKRLDVGVGTLRLKGLEFRDVQLNVDRGETAWIGVYNSDHADGSIRIPFTGDDDRTQLRLSRLNLEKRGDGEEEGASTESATSTLDPETFPPLDLHIERFSIDGHLLGTLSATTSRHPGGVELTSLVIDGEETDLALQGTWIRRPDTLQETTVEFNLDSGEIGPLLSALDLYTDFDKAPAEVDGRLTWFGSPLDLDINLLDGDLALQVGKGHLLELKPGLGRALGLVNISALRRRLTLDFSDLVQKGFAFDSIEGNIRLERGDAFTNNLVVASPSSRIELAGRTGIAAEDLDYFVTVTPHVSSAIPLAGAIAGGPLVGAALLVAQQLVGNQVDEATRLQYLVKGSWSEPEITLKEPPRSEGPERSVEQFGSD